MDREEILLSVCVPTYNRAIELGQLLDSIPQNKYIEVVICDDGSIDNTVEVVKKYRKKLNISYVYQANQGVSKAIKTAYEKAIGKFLIKMDSDDIFVKYGCEQIINIISKKRTIYEAFVFGVSSASENRMKKINCPGFGESNFIAMRADQNIKGDLKEVVSRSIILSHMYDIEDGVRRVPPSLLWVKIADKYSCLLCPNIVAEKTYLNKGITDDILRLKTQFPKPMVELYYYVISSRRYKSKLYRWRCRILWGRYSFHSKSFKFLSWWVLIITLPAYFIYKVDLVRSFWKNFQRN